MKLNKLPMKYGVEMEYECDDYHPYEEIFGGITEKGIAPYRIVGDGSLSSPGHFEVISEPMDSLERLNEFMDNVLGYAQEIGADNRSPCAVHIHVSNIRRPERLFALAERYKEVFEHIRKKNKNGLLHDKLVVVSSNRLEERMCNIPTYNDYSERSKKYWIHKGINPVWDARAREASRVYMPSRRTTLRYSGYDTGNHTLEFRVFPQRMDKKINRIYCQIVSEMINYSQNNQIRTITGLRMKDNFLMLQDFQKMCGLSKTDMYRLLHRKTSPELRKIRKDMLYHEIVNLPKQQTPIIYNGDNIYVGDKYTYKVRAIDENNNAYIYHYVNGSEEGRVTNISLVEGGVKRPDHHFIKKMMDENLEATIFPDQATDDIVFYIPNAWEEFHSKLNNFTIVRYNNTNNEIRLNRARREYLERLWNKSLTPESMGIENRHVRRFLENNDDVLRPVYGRRYRQYIPHNARQTLDELFED